MQLLPLISRSRSRSRCSRFRPSRRHRRSSLPPPQRTVGAPSSLPAGRRLSVIAFTGEGSLRCDDMGDNGRGATGSGVAPAPAPAATDLAPLAHLGGVTMTSLGGISPPPLRLIPLHGVAAARGSRSIVEGRGGGCTMPTPSLARLLHPTS